MALAMPEGTTLRFRYDLRWVTDQLESKIRASEKDSENKVEDTSSLIAYIDQRDTTKPPEIIPCRYTVLARVDLHGTTVSLDLTLKEFAHADDLFAFNQELGTLAAERLPKWDRTEAKPEIEGCYCFEIGQEPGTMVRSGDLKRWEEIVAQVTERKDFKEEGCFYTVRGLYKVDSSARIGYGTRGFDLDPNDQYELRIYNYHPEKTPKNTWLLLDLTSRWLTITSNPLLSIDSRYDQKRVRFETGRPWRDEEVLLSVYRIDGANPQEAPRDFEFDLRSKIGKATLHILGYLIVLAVALASPPIVQVWLDGDLSLLNQIIVTAVALIGGFVVGLIAVFGLQRFP